MQLPSPTALIFLIAVALSVAIIFFSAAPILFNQIHVNQWNGTAPIFIPAADPLDAVDLDADVMWFRNPFPHFFPDGDFQIACDRFFGNHLDRNNIPNGGFNFVKSNNRTIEFYKFWYSSRYRHPGYHDQDVLNSIKFDPFVDEIGLKMRFLSTAFFGGICEPSRNFSLVCTMHANCCVGLIRKLNDLRLILEDWRRYMMLPPALKNSRLPFWRIPQNCSLAPLHQQIL